MSRLFNARLPLELEVLIASFLTIRETEDWCLSFWPTSARVLTHPHHRHRVTVHLQSMKRVLDYHNQHPDDARKNLCYQRRINRHGEWMLRFNDHVTTDDALTIIYAHYPSLDALHDPRRRHSRWHVEPPMVCLI